jgi:hypothetical protein
MDNAFGQVDDDIFSLATQPKMQPHMALAVAATAAIAASHGKPDACPAVHSQLSAASSAIHIQAATAASHWTDNPSLDLPSQSASAVSHCTANPSPAHSSQSATAPAAVSLTGAAAAIEGVIRGGAVAALAQVCLNPEP